MFLKNKKDFSIKLDTELEKYKFNYFDKNNLILVDGSGYIFRAYYALPPMTNPE